MHMSKFIVNPENWTLARDAMVERHRREVAQLDRVRASLGVPQRHLLRPAKANDIKVGAVIYYPDSDAAFWMVVDELLHHGDDFKAYTADDGCRYGLHGAFVRRSKEANG